MQDWGLGIVLRAQCLHFGVELGQDGQGCVSGGGGGIPRLAFGLVGLGWTGSVWAVMDSAQPGW